MSLLSNPVVVCCLAIGILYVTKRWPFQKPISRGTLNLQDSYDYIVVGGGSAGAVVASRLSEDPSASVLVLEAGGHYSNYEEFDVPSSWLDLLHGEADWDYLTEPQKQACLGLKGQRSSWPRGRVLGGSSVLNAMQYTRGNRHEFDEWASLGCEGWSYEDVLPYFRKSEDMTMEDLKTSKYHGTGGPLTISGGDVTPLADRYLQAGRELGYKVLDYNGESQDGVSPIQVTVSNGIRCNTGLAFLGPHQGRENLHIGVNSLVTRIEIKDKKATGVYVIRNGRKQFIASKKEVIVSAGAVNSPQLLLLSGIGPRKHLEDMKIPLVADLPVGESLQDHMVLFLHSSINESVSITDKVRQSYWTKLQHSIFGKGVLSIACTDGNGFFHVDPDKEEKLIPEIQIVFLSTAMTNNAFNFKDDIARENLGRNQNDEEFVSGVVLLHPRSRGVLKLRSTDPFDSPFIDPQYLTDKKDIETFIGGIRVWEKFAETAVFKSMGVDISRNQMSFCSQHLFRSDAYWECFVRQLAVTSYHPTTTCKMGSVDDPTAVVDPQLRVKGIKGLRVVDASIMPNVTTGNTNAPTIMIAEKAADMIRAEY